MIFVAEYVQTDLEKSVNFFKDLKRNRYKRRSNEIYSFECRNLRFLFRTVIADNGRCEMFCWIVIFDKAIQGFPKTAKWTESYVFGWLNNLNHIVFYVLVIKTVRLRIFRDNTRVLLLQVAQIKQGLSEKVKNERRLHSRGRSNVWRRQKAEQNADTTVSGVNRPQFSLVQNTFLKNSAFTPFLYARTHAQTYTWIKNNLKT